MINVQASIEIERPVEEVFAFMTDLEHLPSWLEGVKEARSLSADPTAPGARVTHVNEYLGQAFESTFEVLEWHDNSCTVFKVLSGPLRGESKQTFERLSDDATLVTIEVTGDGTGPLKVGNFLAKRAAQSRVDQSLSNAKELLEEGAGGREEPR